MMTSLFVNLESIFQFLVLNRGIRPSSSDFQIPSLQENKEVMETGEDTDMSGLKLQLDQIRNWSQEVNRSQSQEINVLWRRVKTSASLLTYLKSKARIMAVPHLAQKHCGIKLIDGFENNCLSLANWSRDVDVSLFDRTDKETLAVSKQKGSVDEEDMVYTNEMIKSVQLVADVMEGLVKRVILAESETAIEKGKVSQGQEDIKKKDVQIENMSVKLEEMELFARGTNCILSDMRQRVEDLVDETSRQRERAAENEQELCQVKQDFESLKSYVGTLIKVRETLFSSEKQFQTIEKHFESLVAKTLQLENEKIQKESEVQKLMEENGRLNSLLDKKEAQLLAMNEQCKVMALNASGI